MSNIVGKFATLFQATQLDKRQWLMEADLVFIDPVHGRLVVPRLFETDLASINALRYIAPMLYALLVGYGNASCALHDYLYREGRLSRKESDDVLYRALRGEGVAKWRAGLFWAGVRVFGGRFYNDDDAGHMGSPEMVHQ
ncbi:MAG: DUF1353 domain-containing protein [Pseudomonas sp.]